MKPLASPPHSVFLQLSFKNRLRPRPVIRAFFQRCRPVAEMRHRSDEPEIYPSRRLIGRSGEALLNCGDCPIGPFDRRCRVLMNPKSKRTNVSGGSLSSSK
ncbi:unnamed protein product [Nesidiocoris tenuis]|uniref:Uncharacterized protein n=1 Tax=Nesidiocoris tenuis TaxID=355587 RepID=A0A6H5G4F1_9HEMI|nr:unnamed protein product [Nesidiocoris tenuis]